MTRFLLDTNILIRFCDAGSPAQQLALYAVSELLNRQNEVCVTAQNIIEFWAVATRPLSANGLALNAEQTKVEIDAILDQFLFLEDTPIIFQHWMRMVTSLALKGKRIHDCRLVAVMKAYEIGSLLTFNSEDFNAYADITLVHPQEV